MKKKQIKVILLKFLIRYCYSSIPLYDYYSYKNYINSNYKELIIKLFKKI